MPGGMAMRYFDGLSFTVIFVFRVSFSIAIVSLQLISIPWAGLTVELLEGDCCL